MSSHVKPVIAIHGGAGTIRAREMTAEQEQAYRDGLTQALEAGRVVLERQGSAIDAVTAAVMALEDDPLFNAGRGAVYTTKRTQEMDAAIMDGRDRNAGAVAGIFGPRHPVLAARAVMEKTEHVMLAGDGANEFCREIGLEMKPAEWFFTERRMKALENEMERRRLGGEENDPSRRHGTVGAVACDCFGHVAAATSTGGMTAKTPGRVGDSPVIGAGTWADDKTCAVSATGHGEFFIRYGAAHEIDARIRWGKETLEEAANSVVKDLAQIGGEGGLIAVNAKGEVCLPFNSEGMYRAWMGVDGKIHTGIY
ncbi:MAG: isoaspartyl peptidase/L-asparaginase [Bartonella sp.]|jgi:Asparaginase|nr:isoaspartyl peptidase/L-asparaginase [Bartonella sp.]